MQRLATLLIILLTWLTPALLLGAYMLWLTVRAPHSKPDVARRPWNRTERANDATMPRVDDAAEIDGALRSTHDASDSTSAAARR